MPASVNDKAPVPPIDPESVNSVPAAGAKAVLVARTTALAIDCVPPLTVTLATPVLPLKVRLPLPLSV